MTLRLTAVVLLGLLASVVNGAIVHRSDGSEVAGTLTISGDNLAVQVSPQQTERIALSDVAEISTPATPRPRTGPTPSDVCGLKGEYFAGTEFKNRKILRADPQLNFCWETGADNPLQAAGESWQPLSIRWTGQVIPRYTERYSLITRFAAFARVWIDDQLVMDTQTEAAGIDFQAGHAYRIRIEQIPDSNGKTYYMAWQSARQPREIIPQECFRYPAGDTDLPTAIELTGLEINTRIWHPADLTLVPHILQQGKAPIQAIDYMAGDTLVAHVTGQAKDFLWHNPPPGDYQLWAKVITADGISRTADRKRVFVLDEGSRLPRPWSVGSVGPMKEAAVTVDRGLWTVNAKGGCLFGRTDSCRTVLQPMDGDVECTVHVGKMDGGDHGLAGIVLRDGFAADAPAVGVGVETDGHITWFCRKQVGGESQQNARATKGPSYLRLVRHDQTVRIYASEDNKLWHSIVETQIDLPVTAWGGVFVSGESDSQSAQAEFDALTMHAAPPLPTPGVVLTDGTILQGHVSQVNGDKIGFIREHAATDTQSVTLGLAQIACLLYAPCDETLLLHSLQPNAHGAFLGDSDFCEGDVSGLTPTGVDISSVVFGIKHYDGRTDIRAVVLRPPQQRPARFEMVLTDGSILRVVRLAAAGSTLDVDTTAARGLHISPAEIVRLTPCAATLPAAPSAPASAPHTTGGSTH